MAKLGMTFDVNSVVEREDFSPLVPGVYNGMIVSSDLKTTNKGGEMIVLEIDVQDGEYAGRKLFENLNIKNSNSKAVEIAFRTLGEICRAVGKASIKDSDELHNKRFSMSVAVKPPESYVDKDGNTQPGKPQNVIKKFMPYSATQDGAPKGAATQSSTDQQSVAPWKRKS